MTSPKNNRQVGRISRTQLVAIAVIVLLGAVAGTFVLKSAPSAPVGEAREEHGHEEAKGHSDDEHHAENGKTADGHEDHKDHKDGEHHDKPGEHAEGEEDAVKLSAEQIKSAGIKVEAAGPGRIRTTVDLPGEIKFNEDRTAHVVPRVAGVVEGVSANLGQQVKKGQVLAVISSVLLSEQRSELQAAQKRLALARTTHDREKKLFEDRISPQMDYQQAVQALREAEIAVDNASQKLKALGASPSAGARSS